MGRVPSLRQRKALNGRQWISIAKWTIPLLCLGRSSERNRIREESSWFQVGISMISLVTNAILVYSVDLVISLVTTAILADSVVISVIIDAISVGWVYSIVISVVTDATEVDLMNSVVISLVSHALSVYSVV